MPDLEPFQTLAPDVGANAAANVAPTSVGNANVCACGERQRHANATNDGAPTRFPVSLDTGNVGTPTRLEPQPPFPCLVEERKNPRRPRRAHVACLEGPG